MNIAESAQIQSRTCKGVHINVLIYVLHAYPKMGVVVMQI